MRLTRCAAIGVLCSFLIIFAFIQCDKGDSGDDDPGNPFDDDDESTDDDETDDDDTEDDDDNTDDDDDDNEGVAPQISDAYWDPATVEYDDGVDGWVSWVEFDVCDEDNDLSGGGIYVYDTGTSNLIWSNPLWWDDFDGGAPNAPNCDAPRRIAAGTIFAEGEDPPGYGNENYCVDLEVTDGAGNRSDRIKNLCVVVP
jgi:hypothetical protein